MIGDHELELGARVQPVGKSDPRGAARAGPLVGADAVAPELAGQQAHAAFVEPELRAHDDFGRRVAAA